MCKKKLLEAVCHHGPLERLDDIWVVDLYTISCVTIFHDTGLVANLTTRATAIAT